MRPGTILGDQYEILEELGHGGMGVIYRARDTRLERVVVVKTLSPRSNLDEVAKRRFLREAQAASALDHPNICTIHDIGDTPDGQVFVVMAYYEGHTLRHGLRQRRFSIDECINLGAQLSSALERAHEAGIVHRDLKPSNIQITDRGEAKLLDFGLAKLSSASERMTLTGTTMGTVGYSSPEQLSGEQVDHRTDLWALGVVLYEALSGSNPFRRGTDVATMTAVLHAEPTPLETARPNTPAAVVDVIGLCMEKDPGSRPPDAATVRRVFERTREPTFARPATARDDPNGRARRWLRWFLAALVGLVLFVATLALLG